METIIIWDDKSERARESEIAVSQALRELGLRISITVHSEAPLISRNQLWNRLPVLEIKGAHWSLQPGQAFTRQQLVKLFKKLFTPING